MSFQQVYSRPTEQVFQPHQRQEGAAVPKNFLKAEGRSSEQEEIRKLKRQLEERDQLIKR